MIYWQDPEGRRQSVFENSFTHLHARLCGIFAPNAGYVARYVPFIRYKSPKNCDAQLSERNIKTHFREGAIIYRGKECE